MTLCQDSRKAQAPWADQRRVSVASQASRPGQPAAIQARSSSARHSVERSNGASLRTALTAVVDKSLLAIRRRETRYQKCLERARAARPTTVGGEASAYEDSTPLRLDVQTALSQLSELERQICEALSHGFSIREIAIRLGCDWHTVNRRIAGIRARFTELGLDGWLETS